jgi:4-amino-4-deoxy-L-arabinose transferase-like glycosyltransferase
VTLAAVILIVIIGALLRFHNLGGESLWVDEALSWLEAKDGLSNLIKFTDIEQHPPLHSFALFVAIKLLGDSEWSLRLPAAIFGVANIVAVYWLGTLTFGRTAGLIGAVLLALSPFHIKYSQEARTYSLLALAATLYAATCFDYLRAPSLLRGAGVSLTGLALVYCHPYGLLDWIAIAAAFATFALPSASPPLRSMLVWAAANIVIAAGFVPWALILARQAHGIAAQGFWIPAPTPEFVVQSLVELVGGRLLAGVILIGMVLGVVGRVRRDVAVFCIWIVAPVTVGIVASILLVPTFISRYAIGSLPPMLLVSAFGWSRHAKHWRGAIVSTALVAVAGLSLLRHNPYESAKADWRGVASFLHDRVQAADCVLVVPGWQGMPLSYYRRNSSCQWGATKLANLPTEMPASVLFLIFATQDPIFVPQDPVVAASIRRSFIDELRRRGWREAEGVDFRGIQVVILSR